MTLCLVALAVPIVASVAFPLPAGSGLRDVLIILFDLGALGLATIALRAATHHL